MLHGISNLTPAGEYHLPVKTRVAVLPDAVPLPTFGILNGSKPWVLT